jgi:hypothetical protein
MPEDATFMNVACPLPTQEESTFHVIKRSGKRLVAKLLRDFFRQRGRVALFGGEAQSRQAMPVLQHNG